MDYVDVHLSTKYLHASHMDTFDVDKIHGIYIDIECPLKNPREFYVAYLCNSNVDFTGCFCRV